LEQKALFPETPAFQTRVISRRRDFEGLFEDFSKMRAVTYVASPDLLLEFLDKHGYAWLEIVVGDSLAPARLSLEWRQQLSQKDSGVTERLAERVENGSLRIFVPDRTIHTKLYLLERDGLTRVIVSSANLTESARQARQVNYALFADLGPGDPFLQQVVRDYDAHLKGSSLFMGDLVDLFRERQDAPKKEIVEAWLKGAIGEDQESETRRVFHELSLGALENAAEREEPLITVRLPDAPAARKQVERALSPVMQAGGAGELRVNGLAWIRYVEENHGLPILHVDRERRCVVMGLNGSRILMTEALPDAAALNGALSHVEDYLNTVDCGQTTDPNFAKAAMFEALLYVLFAPFAAEYMKRRRSAYGSVDTRGPRFLYIYGPSQNGKSTFLRFALKLLTGQQIQPLTGNQFTKTKLLQATTLGTAFPLVFDDVVALQSAPNIEEGMKSYWEVWWKSGYVQPQIVLSSNVRTLKEWAKSRVKRVDFDVHFAPSERNKERLARIFEVENRLFRWFSAAYLIRMEQSDPTSDDELRLARATMAELYERAARALPAFFPSEPLERMYDPGRRDWRDLLFGLKKAKTVREKGRLLIEFSDDVPFWEVGEYQTNLPQTVKSIRRGNTLVIESPAEFDAWLESGSPRSRSWFSRWFQR
jgi:hypothetical protein